MRTTLVFFEGPSRLVESLADMAAVLGSRGGGRARTDQEIRGNPARPPLRPRRALCGGGTAARARSSFWSATARRGGDDLASLDAAILAADRHGRSRRSRLRSPRSSGLKRREVYERALELGWETQAAMIDWRTCSGRRAKSAGRRAGALRRMASAQGLPHPRSPGADATG